MRDQEKKRAYMRAYNHRPEHKEQVARSKAKWEEKHGIAYDKAYYLDNKSKINAYNIDYERGRTNHTVYRLDIGGMVYIGSSAHFEKRISRHQTNAKDKRTALLYTQIIQHGWEAVTVTVLERDIPTRLERLIREQEYLDEVPENIRLNTYRAISKAKMHG